MDGKGDIIDQGNEAAELFRKAALSQRQPEGPAATGNCLNCEWPLPPAKPGEPERRWCDAHCRDDYEKQQRAAKMAPREPDPE